MSEEKFERCVQHVKQEIAEGKVKPESNPWAICHASVEDPPEGGSMAQNCSPSICELRNAFVRELQGEDEASSKYREASGKFAHQRNQAIEARQDPEMWERFALTLSKMSSDELSHRLALQNIIDSIDIICECKGGS